MFSIIIPVYNGEKYIARCIKSVINQNYSNFEIIVINDGSTDSTLKICNAILLMTDKLKIISNENKGVSYSRNKGFELCSGDYILFIDADDYIDNNLLKTANDFLEKNNVDIYKFGYVKKYGLIKKKNKFICKTNEIISKAEIAKNLCNNNDFANVWNCFIKRSIIGNHRFDINLRYGEDRKFMSQIISQCNSIYVNKKCFYNYCINSNSMMNRTGLKKSFKQFYDVLSCNKYIYTEFINYISKEDYYSSVKSDMENLVYNTVKFNNYYEYTNGINEILNYNISYKGENKSILFDYLKKIDNIASYKLLKNKYVKKKIKDTFLKLICKTL